MLKEIVTVQPSRRLLHLLEDQHLGLLPKLAVVIVARDVVIPVEEGGEGVAMIALPVVARKAMKFSTVSVDMEDVEAVVTTGGAVVEGAVVDLTGAPGTGTMTAVMELDAGKLLKSKCSEDSRFHSAFLVQFLCIMLQIDLLHPFVFGRPFWVQLRDIPANFPTN